MNSLTSTPSNGLLSIGKSAVAAQQQMLNTTSNNIANVGTDGYVRQRSQTYTSLLNYGVGETLTQRLNNEFTQQEVWRDTSANSYYDTIYNQLASIDKYFSSESTGMSGAILNTFKSLQSAVNDPSSLAQRSEFIGSCNNLTNRFNTLYQDIHSTQEFNSSRITEDVGVVNDILANIANLNKSIQAAMGDKSSVTYNLMDQRDAAIKDLSKYLDIRTVDQKDGVKLVTLSTGHSLVLEDGNHAVLSEVPGRLDYSNSQISITYKNTHGDKTATTLDSSTLGGELGGYLEVRTEIEEAEKSLGQLAIAMADAFNNANSKGVDLNGKLGGDIFSIPPLTVAGSRIGTSLTVEVNKGEGSNVTTDDFYIEFTSDTEFDVYTMKRDNSEKTLIAGKNTGNKLNLADYGIIITFDENVQNGDKFFFQPTQAAAFNIKTEIKKESELALASAVKIETDTGNFGKATAEISAIYDNEFVVSSGNSIKLKDEEPDYVIVNQDGDYEVFSGTGSLGIVSKSTEGKNILAALAELNHYDKTEYGFDISINGKVYAGDRFDIQINSNGIGDNRNGLAMCAMQSEDLVADSSRNGIKQNFTERYSMLTSGFGTVVSNAQANATASEAKLAQSTDLYESNTGVSLDEEAANLVKFQQYYQAAARIISASQTVFDALISAV
ncbi:MAG: flagellar hook-associated protein FlgK [Succinivibrionaceae bacterium]|nr:flagellar hook-associated protein FlgK [Succinivibrionaceae bacterium]